MKRVLVTGMSGTGRSTLIAELAARGYRALDADDGLSERGPDGDWVWRKPLIRQLLATEREGLGVLEETVAALTARADS